MKENIESIPNDMTILEASEFWGNHSVADYPSQIIEIDFTPDDAVTVIAIAKELADQLKVQANQNGVSIETLVNLWVQEKLQTI